MLRHIQRNKPPDQPPLCGSKFWTLIGNSACLDRGAVPPLDALLVAFLDSHDEHEECQPIQKKPRGELVLTLVVRPLRIMAIEGCGMMSPDHNVDIDLIFESIPEDLSYEVESLRFDHRNDEALSASVEILVAAVDEQECDFIIVGEQHVCPHVVSAALNTFMFEFVKRGGVVSGTIVRARLS